MLKELENRWELHMLHDTIFFINRLSSTSVFLYALYFVKKGICRLAGFTIVSFGLSYYKLNMDMNLPFLYG